MVVLPLRNPQMAAVVGIATRRLPSCRRTFVTSRSRRADVAPRRTNNKIWNSADEAVADLQSGKIVFSGVSCQPVPSSSEQFRSFYVSVRLNKFLISINRVWIMFRALDFAERLTRSSRLLVRGKTSRILPLCQTTRV